MKAIIVNHDQIYGSTMNPTPTPSSAGNSVCTDELTNLPPEDSPLDSEKDDSVDFSQEQGLRIICTSD
jgi:hypothetical protein